MMEFMRKVGRPVARKTRKAGRPVARKPRKVGRPVAGNMRKVGRPVAEKTRKVGRPVAGKTRKAGFIVKKNRPCFICIASIRHQQQIGIATRRGRVDGYGLLGQKAQQIMRAASLGPGA